MNLASFLSLSLSPQLNENNFFFLDFEGLVGISMCVCVSLCDSIFLWIIITTKPQNLHLTRSVTDPAPQYSITSCQKHTHTQKKWEWIKIKKQTNGHWCSHPSRVELNGFHEKNVTRAQLYSEERSKPKMLFDFTQSWSSLPGGLFLIKAPK